MMNNKTSRINTMNNANINTKNFYSISVDKIPVGAQVTVLVDGKPMSMEDFTINDPIAEMIEENGYVKNTKLFRRWIAAQTFKMLNYKSWDGKEVGWDAALRNLYDYNYQFKQLAEELRVIGILEKEDKSCFEERTTYFNKDVAIALMRDYVKKARSAADEKVMREIRWSSYSNGGKRENVTIWFYSGSSFKYGDFYKEVTKPTEEAIYAIRDAFNHKEVAKIFSNWMKETFRKLNKNTAKCKEWKDAFKGSGAYFTLKNMVMFHDVVLTASNGHTIIAKEDAVNYLNLKRHEYFGEGWRMHEYLKLIINMNNFDLVRSIRAHQ